MMVMMVMVMVLIKTTTGSSGCTTLAMLNSRLTIAIGATSQPQGVMQLCIDASM